MTAARNLQWKRGAGGEIRMPSIETQTEYADVDSCCMRVRKWKYIAQALSPGGRTGDGIEVSILTF